MTQMPYVLEVSHEEELRQQLTLAQMKLADAMEATLRAQNTRVMVELEIGEIFAALEKYRGVQR